MPDNIAVIAATIPTSAATYWPQFSLQTSLSNWVVVVGSASPWYVDALKAGIGSLFGALVAFLFAVWHRWIQERNANLRAGNLALFKLRAIQRRTGELRRGVRHDIAEKRKVFADTPTWSLLRPLLLTTDDIDVFDLDSLSFLLSNTSGRDAVKHVKYADELFATLKAVLAYHQNTAFEFQKATVDLRRATPNASWDEIKEHVGMELVSRRDSLFDALLLQVERNPAINKGCFMKLEAAMRERFRTGVWELDIDFDPKSPRAEQNLPALPDDIAKALAETPS